MNKSETKRPYIGMIDLQKNNSAIRCYDIVCGRDSSAYNNIGNRRFRVTISLNVERYINASTRKEKKLVIQSVMDTLTRDAGARFLKRISKNSTKFMILGPRDIRNKIQHALRDMAAMKSNDLSRDSSNSNRPKEEGEGRDDRITGSTHSSIVSLSSCTSRPLAPSSTKVSIKPAWPTSSTTLEGVNCIALTSMASMTTQQEGEAFGGHPSTFVRDHLKDENLFFSRTFDSTLIPSPLSRSDNKNFDDLDDLLASFSEGDDGECSPMSTDRSDSQSEIREDKSEKNLLKN